MKNYIPILTIGLFSLLSYAHTPTASTTMLVERENNTWVLQISASLTAFQQEIRTHFSGTPYKTPEEFQQMVLEHMKNNLLISFNGKDISFGKGVVKLGHETKVVFELFGIPPKIQTVRVKNDAFQNIHKSQSALVLLKEGFNKEHFVLNDANDHTLQLYVEGKTFKILDTKESNTTYSYLSWVLGGVFLLIMAFMALSNMFRPEKIELRSIG